MAGAPPAPTRRVGQAGVGHGSRVVPVWTSSRGKTLRPLGPLQRHHSGERRRNAAFALAELLSRLARYLNGHSRPATWQLALAQSADQPRYALFAPYLACAGVKPSYSSCSIRPERENAWTSR
jgi:hypothetical protein